MTRYVYLAMCLFCLLAIIMLKITYKSQAPKNIIHYTKPGYVVTVGVVAIRIANRNALPQIPSWGHNGQNWSLPLSTDPVWWRSMHAISVYRGNRPTNKQTHRQDRLQYTAPQLASTWCKYETYTCTSEHCTVQFLNIWHFKYIIPWF